MIRTLGVNCSLFLVSSKDHGKTEVDKASDEMVIGAVPALCQFSLHVSQRNHLGQSLKALDNALKRFYKEKGIF